MKRSQLIFISLIIALFSFQNGEAQILKKLKKRAEKAAEDAVIHKTEKKVYDETSKKMDTILGNDNESKSKKNTKTTKKDSNHNKNGQVKDSNGLEETDDNEVAFKRGNTILFKDDFSLDAIGDFPAKWNTTVGGEIKRLKGFNNKFLKVPANAVINLEMTKPLPENFTAELDIIIPEDAPIRMAAIGFAKEIPKKIDYLITSENDIRIMFYSYADLNTDALKFGTNTKALGYTYQSANYKVPLNKLIHVAFVVNGHRFRSFIDGEKMVDLPTSYNPKFSNVFYVSGVTHGDNRSLQNYFYISNVLIAETGTDVRSSVVKDLIEKGNFTTNDIHFDSGSDKIQASSHEILNQIGEAMQANPNMKFKIVGHTDSDGDTNSNLVLSEKRASAVKDYLTSKFNIFAKNLFVEGKGESQPVADNNSVTGKSKNRRVEFVKL